jgi:TRAP-type C4-dicarboxylate transport system permease small subunit
MMLKRLDILTGKALDFIAKASFLTLFVLVTLNVIIRFVPVMSMAWTDEIVELTFAWTVFFGSAALWRQRQHFRADMLILALGERTPRIVAEIAIELLNLTFLAIFTWLALSLWLSANDASPILGLPRRIWYAAMPLAGLIMTVYSLRDLVSLLHGRIPAGAPLVEGS